MLLFYGVCTAAGNVCFHGNCTYYCDTAHPVCGRPQLVEGSMSAFLPETAAFRRTAYRNPWTRTYHKRDRPDWETASRLGAGDAFCRNVTRSRPYDHGRRMLDVIDMTIFDFLTGRSVRVGQGRSIGVGLDRSVQVVDRLRVGRGVDQSRSVWWRRHFKVSWFAIGWDQSADVVSWGSRCVGHFILNGISHSITMNISWKSVGFQIR